MSIHLTWTSPLDPGTGIVAYKLYKRSTSGTITPSDFFQVFNGSTFSYDDPFYDRRHLEEVGYFYKITALTDEVESDLLFSNLIHVQYSFEDILHTEIYPGIYNFLGSGGTTIGGISSTSPNHRIYVYSGSGGLNLGGSAVTSFVGFVSCVLPGDGVIGTGHGVALSYTDNGNGTVTDNNTGLTWEIKTTTPGIHYVENTYTYSAFVLSDVPNGTAFTVFLDTLNSTNFAGHNDWRMPRVKELESIADYSKIYPGPAISSSFPGTARTEVSPGDLKGAYFSFTDFAKSVGGAEDYLTWVIDFSTGFAGALDKAPSVPQPVRAVRGDSSCLPGDGYTAAHDLALSYTDNGNGTVTDNNTGLLWEIKGTTAGIHHVDNMYTWSTSGGPANGTVFTVFLDTLNSTNFGGHNDWRLPTIKELMSIMTYTVGFPDPALPPGFPGVQKTDPTVSLLDFYWSFTTYAADTTQVWGILGTQPSVAIDGKGVPHVVRAVRG